MTNHFFIAFHPTKKFFHMVTNHLQERFRLRIDKIQFNSKCVADIHWIDAFPYQSSAGNFPQFQNPSAPVETLRVLIKREDCCNWEPSLLLYSSWTKTTADANNSRSDSKISLGGAGGAAKMGGKELQTKTLQVASASHIVRQNPKASGLLGN